MKLNEIRERVQQCYVSAQADGPPSVFEMKLNEIRERVQQCYVGTEQSCRKKNSGDGNVVFSKNARDSMDSQMY